MDSLNMTSLSPSSLDDFVGQSNARRIIRILVTAAKRRDEPVPHLLMSGPPGLGKTTLARIIAKERGGNLIEIVGSAVKSSGEMTEHLAQLKTGDVLFIDEIHALPRRLEELLYPAMEDRSYTPTSSRDFDELIRQLAIQSCEKPTTMRRLPPFTLVGATTLLGLTTAPLRSRFRQIVELEPYSEGDLQTIIANAAKKLQFELPPSIVHEIAVRSRGTARTAISNLMWYRDYVQADGGVATQEALFAAFELKGVDRRGLIRQDRQYLRHLLESTNERALSVDTLASLLGESVETIQVSVEPFLLQQGLITKTQRGRLATEKAKLLAHELSL